MRVRGGRGAYRHPNAERGIKRNAAKTQLAHAMAKIGVGDQRELIRRGLRLPALRETPKA